MKSFLVVCILAIPAASFCEWNQWRGPDRNGKIEGSSWPADLSGLSERWSVALAEGYSSPIVQDGKLFTVETKDKKDEIARCLDLADGKELWQVDWEGSMKVPFFAAKNGSWVRATPAIAGDGLYVGGIRDVLVKLNPADGSEVWRIDFVEREETQLPTFGYVCSPLVDGEYLYTQAGCAVTKIKRSTGETIWRAMENRQAMFGSAFSSPVIATIHDKRQLVAQTRSHLGGIDLESGEVLWTIPVKAFRGMNILTPEIIGNRIFTATYGGGSLLYEVSRDGDDFSVAEVWKDEKLEGYMSSPVAIGDAVYVLGRDQKFRSINLADGKVNWVSDEKFGQYWSMIANGDKILALDQKGELLLIKAAADKLNILDRTKVSEQETWAHVGIEDGAVLVRGLKEMKVFDWK
ncbi:MAG: PQQ-binding-like beta-propeller repeat protein [Verrucomicrobiota bacterium]